MHTISSPALIVFVRKPELGKVKTRLAATMGDVAALKVYELLLAHTQQVAVTLELPVYVYYACGIGENDIWQGPHLYKKEQQGVDLGQRMAHAFAAVFAEGHGKVVIIGSDCYALTAPMVQTAFQQLQNSDAVIGPATDGGYYLLGLSRPMPQIFEGIVWSTPTVAAATMGKLYQLDCSVSMLQPLPDIDEEKDLPEEIKKQL
jgi:uncharacterized protein